MWRNQARFSSNLFLSKSNPNPNPFISPSSPNPLELHKRGYLLSHLHSSTGRLPLSPNPSFGRERAYGFSSSATIPGSPALSYASVSAAGNVPAALRHYGRCYWELSKAKLSMLVVATSGAGFVLGSGTAIDFAGLCWTCTGTMMVAASANSLNQIFEKYNDAKMKRTRKRPLPSGRLSIPHAAIWASSVGFAGTILLACKANILAAGLGASTLALYAFVYTPLKQIHPINTWVGAIVGAIPPALGWAAASGQISLDGMILPAALYFWQIPHFMALAYLCRDDYAAGGFRMFSLADVSGHRTALVAFRNSLYLLPLGFLAYDWGITSGWFCLESGALTLAIAATAYSFYKNPTVKSARKMFHASLLYLPVFMSGLMVHRLTDNHQEVSETNTRTFSALPSSEIESDYHRKNQRKVSSMDIQARPPVAYASVAPFPFLPVPVYADSEL